MSTTLYLLRRPADQIPTSVFRASENEGDIVALDDSALTSLSSSRTQIPTVRSARRSIGSPSLTYEELIDRIFDHDHVIVI